MSARYCLADISALRTSHLPLDGFRPNPDYPPEAQERRYDADPAERLKVETVANNLNPELIFLPAPTAVDGPPVVAESGIVLGGNGRTMALTLAYARGGTAVKEYLVHNAKTFGLTPHAVEQLAHPVVVRVIGGDDVKPETFARWSRRLNEAMTGGIDSRALAVSQSRLLDERALAVLTAELEPSETLAEYLSSERSRMFVAELRRLGIVFGPHGIGGARTFRSSQ